jgi:two-component system nitrogen regulation response regulator NtrX
MRVLILDDDRDLRDILCELLESEGAMFLGAASFDEVVQLGSKALACDLVVLDVNLGPNSPSGVDVYRWLIQQGYQGRIVFMTGHAQTYPGIQAAFDVGVEVLGKPFSIEKILELVK